LSSFLKKTEKPLEFKVLSQNSSRSEIKVDTEKNKINFDTENDKEIIVANNQLETKKNYQSTTIKGNFESENEKHLKNLNVLSQNETDETANEILFTFHKNETNENFADLSLTEMINFKQSLLKLKKRNLNCLLANSSGVYKELTSIRDLINEILK